MLGQEVIPWFMFEPRAETANQATATAGPDPCIYVFHIFLCFKIKNICEPMKKKENIEGK